MFTRSGEQNLEPSLPAFISLKKGSRSTHMNVGCCQVKYREMRCDTKASSAVTDVHGLAGTWKTGISVILFTSIYMEGDRFGILAGPSSSTDAWSRTWLAVRQALISSIGALLRMRLMTSTKAGSFWLRIVPTSRKSISRSCSNDSILRLRVIRRRPSLSALMTHGVFAFWQGPQGVPPIHYQDCLDW